MKIFHGENQIASRNAYLAFKKQHSNPIELLGTDLTHIDLMQATSATSLFGEAPSVFIEGFFSRRPSNEKKQIIDYLSQHSDLPVTFWDATDVSTHVKTLNPTSVTRFDLPKYIFSFLDNLDLDSYHRCLESMPAEQLFASLVTRLHKVMTGEGRFKKNFTHSQLSIFNSQLLNIDYAQKTSSSPYDLTVALELFIVKHVN